MKQFVILIICLSSLKAFSQAGIKDSEMYFYGIDFSKSKMIGEIGFTDPKQIQSYYFGVWNQLMVSEQEKYDLKKAFGKSKVNYDLGIVEAHNNAVNADNLVTNSAYSLDEKSIPGIIKSYKIKEEKGLGMVFVVSSFDKLNEVATLYAVYFDIDSKKVLLSKKLTGKPTGFGFRNYWAGALYAILKSVPSQRKAWEAEVK